MDDSKTAARWVSAWSTSPIDASLSESGVLDRLGVPVGAYTGGSLASFTPVTGERIGSLTHDDTTLDVYLRSQDPVRSVEVLQVAALCWCGRRGTHQARTIDGAIVRDGDQVVVGDVDGAGSGQVAYEVLCRDHHRRGLTAAHAGREHQSRDPLPFGE